MGSMPKDATIEKWIKSCGSKKKFENDMLRRLDVVEDEYKAKKSKIKYILRRLRDL